MRRRAAVLVLAFLASAAAWAFPWDIDMVDSSFFRAFEWEMRPIPDGVASVNRYRGGYDRSTRMMPEGAALSSPHTADPALLRTGERMFVVYCQTCHGPKGQGGAPMADMSGGKKRFPIPPALLSGAGAITPLRSDGYIFLTIQQGGAIMPPYGYAMSDQEIWAVVAYIRTLEGAQYKPPETP
jgi:mono/diheme cytochrome c family protein